MKDRPDAILRPEQADYLARLLPPRSPILAEIEEVAAFRSVPISDPEVGRLLAIVARLSGGSRFLELGTALGYGTIALALAVESARVTTIERDPDLADEAWSYFERAGIADRVDLRIGEVLDLLPRLEGPFDLVYIDSDKSIYRRALDLSLPLLRVGGAVVVDNLLWKGRVAEPPLESDEATEAISAFNPYLSIHPQLDALVLPLADGVGVGVKTRPTMRELGGPF